MSYKLTDVWSVTAGARQTFDRKNMLSQPNVPGPSGRFEAKFDRLTLELGTEYRLAPQKMAYLHFSQGYRGGGINGDAASLAAINTYKPERVNSYEGGLKTEWLDNALILNLSAFYYDYRDLQLSALDVFPGGFTTRIVNATGLDIKGVELESVMRPAEGLTFNASLGYLDASYKSQILNIGFGPVQLRGLRKDNAPKWTGYFGADYRIPLAESGSITLSGDVAYRSTFATQPVPSLLSVQKSYALLNGSVTWRTADERFTFALFGRNLTNKYYKTFGESGGGLFSWELAGRPRTWGVRAAASF